MAYNDYNQTNLNAAGTSFQASHSRYVMAVGRNINGEFEVVLGAGISFEQFHKLIMMIYDDLTAWKKKEGANFNEQALNFKIPLIITEVKQAKNGMPVRGYEKMKPVPKSGFFEHIPGCYCNQCGETFALYSHSSIKPTLIDENKIPYYDGCPLCTKNIDQ